jgi:DNA polymerase IV
MNGRSRPRRAIGFAEVPDFHVAVARRADPSLLDRAILVGGDPRKRGKVLASSADLQKLGVGPGMPLSEALDRAPAAVWVHTDMAHAREVSGLFRATVRKEIEALELDGLGGFFWEASSQRDESLALAERVEARVRTTLGLPLRIGIAPVRFAARWAAEDAGVAGACVIDDDEFDAYLTRQPIERFPGVGPKTAARLAELGASDVPSLRALGRERLEVLLGNHGRALWLLACGTDEKPLRAKRHPKTLSREKSIADSRHDPAGIVANLEILAASLGSVLVREGLGAGRVALRLTLDDSRTLTRSQTLSAVVSSAGELAVAARGLLARADVNSASVRKLALVVAGLEIQGAKERQLGLF